MRPSVRSSSAAWATASDASLRCCSRSRSGHRHRRHVPDALLRAIGVAAPVIVILFRLLQGFALGGEVGPTTAYMAEAAPPQRRGLYISMQYATQDCATLVAGLIGSRSSQMLSERSCRRGAGAWRCSVGARSCRSDCLAPRLPETLHAGERRDGGDRKRTATSRGSAALSPVVVFGIMMLTAGTSAITPSAI